MSIKKSVAGAPCKTYLQVGTKRIPFDLREALRDFSYPFCRQNLEMSTFSTHRHEGVGFRVERKSMADGFTSLFLIMEQQHSDDLDAKVVAVKRMPTTKLFQIRSV